MSALRGRKYTMLSDIILARRKISNVVSVKGDLAVVGPRPLAPPLTPALTQG